MQITLKEINEQDGFVVDDKLYDECAKRLRVHFSKEIIANIIAAFLAQYEDKTKRK
jgi:hypothetical protein